MFRAILVQPKWLGPLQLTLGLVRDKGGEFKGYAVPRSPRSRLRGVMPFARARRTGQRMPFKSLDDVLQPDPRFADLCIVRDGTVQPMTLSDYHGAIHAITLDAPVQEDVDAAFDRAKNAILYAFFE